MLNASVVQSLGRSPLARFDCKEQRTENRMKHNQERKHLMKPEHFQHFVEFLSESIKDEWIGDDDAGWNL